MKTKKILLSALVLFIFAILWNSILHMVILKDINSVIEGLRRENLNDMLSLSLMMTAIITLLFSFGYSKIRKTGKIQEGINYGLFFGFLAILFADLNQYIVYPIPLKVIICWSIGGLLEFTLYGIIISLFNSKEQDTT